MYVSDIATNDWDEFLTTVQLAINNTYNDISEIPFFALFGYDTPTVAIKPQKLSYKADDITDHFKRVTQIHEYTRKCF